MVSGRKLLTGVFDAYGSQQNFDVPVALIELFN